MFRNRLNRENKIYAEITKEGNAELKLISHLYRAGRDYIVS